jgi:pimeloyl-ACP methyl ester carboxylesterase
MSDDLEAPASASLPRAASPADAGSAAPNDAASAVPLTHRLDGPEGAPVIALLNGGMMSLAAWDAVATPLRTRWRVLACDFRGQLLSPGTPPADLAGHARDVVALLDHLGLAAVHLVGASYGAEVAVELAATHPDRVRSLVVITAMDRETPAFRAGSDTMRGLIAEIRRGGGRDAFYDALVADVYSPAYRAREAATFAARRPQMAFLPLSWFEGVDGLLAGLEGWDLGPRLTQVRSPALAVHAAQDGIMDAARSRALAEGLCAEVVTHPTAGHALVAEDPAWLVEVLGAFLERQEARGA